MTSNTLKIIACLAMACDHICLILFPELTVLRWIGRLAMPIFAYFIAQGCLHTRSKTKYFLQLLALAVVCQLFYIGEALIHGGIRSIYLNILFTFSLSVVVSSAYLRLANTVRTKEKHRLFPDIALFAAALCLAVFCCSFLSPVIGIPVTVDYSIVGVLLPLSALIFTDKRKSFLSFCAGTIIYCLVKAYPLPYAFFTLLSLPLLALYNGQRGTKKLKWAFYIFYPAHFALLYALSLLP